MAGFTPSNPSRRTTEGTGVDPFPLSSTSSRNPTFSASQQGCNKDNQFRSNKEQINTKADFDANSEVVTDTNTNITTKDTKDKDSGAEDQDDSEMPKPRPQPVKRDADISLILTPAQRIDMVKLNEGIHAKLEEQVMKPFNYLHLPVAQGHRIKMWNYAPAVAAQTPKPAAGTDAASTTASTHSTNASASASGNPGKPGKDQVEAQEEAPAEAPVPRFIPKIDADSVKPTVSSMSVLKEEATQYFNKWKMTFNKRFNDLIVPNQPNFNGGPSRQGQGAPRGGGAGAGPAGRIPQQGMLGNSSSPIRLLSSVPTRRESNCHQKSQKLPFTAIGDRQANIKQ